MNKGRSRVWKITSKEFKEIVFNSESYKDIANALGYSTSGVIYKAIKDRIEYEGIDCTHIHEARRKASIKRAKELNERKEITPLSMLLIENSNCNRTYLKDRLIKEGLLKEKCSKCGLGPKWEGESLTLQLDHENGIKDDNRLENLRLLCPNCHSQTKTYAGRNTKWEKIERKCINSDCNKNVSRQSKSGYCIDCSRTINLRKKKKTVVKKIEKKIKCKKCSKSITMRSKSGMCNPCINKANSKVEKRPSRTELIELILTKPFLQIGSRFGVSDNAIRKWCKAESLPVRKSDINNQREVLEKELDEAKIINT